MAMTITIECIDGQRNMSCRLNTVVFTDNMQDLLHGMHMQDSI